MGDDHFALVHGKGSVALEFSSGKTITLFNVLYVPKLHKNLVCGPMLNKCGYKQVYESDKYILSKSGVFVGFDYYNSGMFMLNLNKVPDDSDSVYMSSIVVNSSLWHARLGHVHYKRMLGMSKDDLIPAIDENLEKNILLVYDAFRFCYVYLLHAKDEALDKFRIYKTEVELQQNDLIKTLRTDRGGEYYDPIFFQSVGIIHETTAPYIPQQNGVAEMKNRSLKEMVNSMLSYSGLSEGFWGEAMLTACYLLNKVPNKRNKTTPYELWYKKRPNSSFLRVWGCRAVVRLPDPKRKTLGEKGIDCICVGYAEHSKAYRFYVIKPNDFVSINSIIESRDAIFDDNRFFSIPRPKNIIPNVQESQMDDHTDDLYLVEGSRDQGGSQYSYCFSIEEDPRTYNEAMQYRDVAFWKEAIDDEIGSIMENNTWVLSNLPPGCKPLGCKWIFKRKIKVDGTIDKFKARLVIKGFRQKEGIDYLDTYAPVARITTFRLLLALSAIHNLVIHQIDVKIAFLNGDLDKEVYMKQPKGFVMLVSLLEKILKKFNPEDCSPMNTPIDLVEKLKPNTGKPVDHLEYSRAIGCLMYAMTSTRPDIAYVVGRLSRFTSNPSRQHWKVITRVFKYLREGYSDASWINHVEDSSSTSGWVFLLGGGAILWASKKQTCITSSTMESELVALVAAGKEAKWLRNLIFQFGQNQ
ncbi:zinc finger, CCHC-type containing protein [Tanacetum coccineum]